MKRLATVLFLIALMLTAGGCNYVRWLSTMWWEDETSTKVKAQYLGLDGKSVAVVVAADEFVLHRYPTAPREIGKAIGDRLVTNLPSVKLMDPAKVDKFLEENPYWDVVSYRRLLEGLGVERVVFVELIEYRTHEPGNAHVWQGMMAGNVGVLSVDADNPDDFVFYTTIRDEFPENNKFGVVNSSDADIRLGLHSLFSRDAAGLFYDHTKTQPRL